MKRIEFNAKFAELVGRGIPVEHAADIVGVSRATAYRMSRRPEVKSMIEKFRDSDPDRELTAGWLDGKLIRLIEWCDSQRKSSARALQLRCVEIGYRRLGIERKVENETNINIVVADLSDRLERARKRVKERILEGQQVSSDTPASVTGASQGEGFSSFLPSPAPQASSTLERSCRAEGSAGTKHDLSLPLKRSHIFNCSRKTHGHEDLGEWRPSGMKDDTRPLNKAELEAENKKDWCNNL